MLIYNPAFDSYHGIFRVLRLLTALEPSAYEIDRMRILDFYLLFPGTLQHVTFPRGAMKYRRMIPDQQNRYERIEDGRRLFSRLEPFQTSAFRYLAARDIIEPHLFAENRIQRGTTELPTALATTLAQANATDSALMDLLTGPFSNLDLYGASGLRGRSHLFEHRYDPSSSLTFP
ncbi:MAG: hypothetical protein QOI07_2846 [Verrucomicrobiota bacterium]|jgi:hypothetical protein